MYYKSESVITNLQRKSISSLTDYDMASVHMKLVLITALTLILTIIVINFKSVIDIELIFALAFDH